MIESSGIPTAGITIERRFTEQVRPPRSVFLKWPYGHPLGEPGNVKQHHAVLWEALKLLAEAREPGVIVDLPFRWKRESYD